MKNILIISILSIFWIYPASGQQPVAKNPKSYEVWVKQSGNIIAPKGILYEIRDSAICVRTAVGDPRMAIYGYKSIIDLKIRKAGSIRRGAIAGSVIGAAFGIIMINSIPGGLSFMTVPVSFISGLFAAVPGAGIGFLSGAIRDRIPVKQSYENFSKYRQCLREYSYVQEPAVPDHLFRHRTYAGADVGISFASGEFADKVLVDDYHGMNLTGYSFTEEAGYRYNEYFGLKLSLTGNSFSVKESEGAMDWEFDSFLICPVVSFPLSGKVYAALEPGIGFASVTLADEKDFLMNGSGLGLRLSGSVVYDYAKRWTASAKAGYLYSEQKFDEGGKGKASSFDLQVGLAYKFGKRSL